MTHTGRAGLEDRDERGKVLAMSSLVASVCLAVEDARREEEQILWSAGQVRPLGARAEPWPPTESALFLFCQIQARLLDRIRDIFLAAIREGSGLLPWEDVLSCRVLIETHFTVARSRLARKLPAERAGGGAAPEHDVQVQLLLREMEGFFACLKELRLVGEDGVPKNDVDGEHGSATPRSRESSDEL